MNFPEVGLVLQLEIHFKFKQHQMSKVQPVPADSASIIPMLVCRNVSAEIAFCKTVFEAVELSARSQADGTVVHALLRVSGEMVIIEAQWPSLASAPPSRDGSSPVVIFVYVEDVDAVVSRALSAGATALVPVKDQFWGDRTGRIMDPEGHVWTVSSRIEVTSSAERDERWSSIAKGKS